MNIVLNEHDWAEEKIISRSLGDEPFETLSRVAKYYIDQNYTKSQTRKILDDFILQCDPSASLPRWSKTLDHAVSSALKYDIVKIDSIEITDSEMNQIDCLESKPARRLAFTLLCLAKYWDIINPQGNHWVNSKENKIMKMANIDVSVKQQSLLYHILYESGMIQFSKRVDNTNVRICFITPGETVIAVTDFRNLGYQYLKYHGQPYFECENCGVTVKRENKLGRKQKYCKECAAKIHIQQSVNTVMKQ